MERKGSHNAGYSLLELMIGFAIISVLAAIAIPNLVHTQQQANQGSAVQTMRVIIESQAMYRTLDMDGDGADNFAPDLPTLINAKLVDDGLLDNTKTGYTFNMVVEMPGRRSWTCTAVPSAPQTGELTYFTDESAVIRFETSAVADKLSPPIGN